MREDVACHYIVGHDLVVKTSTAVAQNYPNMTSRVVVAEYALSNFGALQDFLDPSSSWTLNSNWHYGLLTVPGVGEFPLQNKEQRMLEWYFWNTSYQSNPVPPEHFSRYLRNIQKPGYLRSSIGYYLSLWEDINDFSSI
jgi:hypothetical protein